MDHTTLIRAVSGVIAVVIAAVLVQRRRRHVK
jgi:hypothetical protein